MDDRGRFTITKEIGLRGTKVIVIQASTYFIVLPIHGDTYQYGELPSPLGLGILIHRLNLPPG